MARKKAEMIEQNGCQIRVVHVDRVARARKEAVPERQFDWLSGIFKTLGDPMRLKMALALQVG